MRPQEILKCDPEIERETRVMMQAMAAEWQRMGPD